METWTRGDEKAKSVVVMLLAQLHA